MDRKRILVVDDDIAWLSTIKLMLEGRYDLELTTSPSDALSLVKLSPFSLAILDQRLGENLSGIELLIQLRAIRPSLRGIILTGFAEIEDAVKSMKVGAFDYISKGQHDLAAELRVRVENAIVNNPHEDAIPALIERGESAELEFKSSARWDIRQNKMNRDLERVIIKTVAGFLNSELGGVLLIGVNDAGEVIGLANDYKTLKKQDRDGFENFIITLLLDEYGKDVGPLLHIDFHDISGNDVCRVSARPAPRAVYADSGEHLYIRIGNSTRQLSTQEAVEFCKVRWK